MCIVLCGHSRRAEELQLVELYRREWQRIYQLGLLDKHLVALAWKSQYKVRSAMNSSLGSQGHSSLGAGEVVTAIDSPKCIIVTRLDAILNGHISPLGQLCEVIQLLLIYAIGTCAYHNSRHFGVSQSLVVTLSEPLLRGIGVGVRLKIGQILLGGAVTSAVKLYTLVNLLCDAL